MSTNPQQLERIVAYLDGELSAEESSIVEQQLASDEQFRQELQSAQRAWSALDELPMPHVGDDFSRTTMEMVVDAAQHDVQAKTIAMPIQRRKRKRANVLALVVTFLLGALAARIVAQNPNRDLLADLPVIQNVDLYTQFEDVEFLRDLQSRLGEVEELAVNKQLLDERVQEFVLISDSDKRRAWIESLDDDEKTTLRGKFNRYRDLSGKRQDAIRSLHSNIASDGNQDQLVKTMYVYQQWLNELEPGEQYQLRLEAPEDRVVEAAREIRRSAYDLRFKLSDEQLRELFKQVFTFLASVRKEIRSGLDPELKQMAPEDKLEAFMLSRPELIRRAVQRMTKDSPGRFRELTETITNALPDDVSKAFQELNPRQQMEKFRAWQWQLRTQVEKERRPGQPGNWGLPLEEELEHFFVDELEPDQKERLLALPRDQMHQQLVMMLQGKHRQYDRQGPYPPGGQPPDGRGPRGPRDDRWRDGPGPPPRGERGGPPRDGFPGFEDGPRRSPRDFGQRPEGRGPEGRGPEGRRRGPEDRPDQSRGRRSNERSRGDRPRDERQPEPPPPREE